jgi:hypothetical protein
VTVFAAAGLGALDAEPLLANRVSAALTAGTAMLGLALVLVVALIARPAKAVASAVAGRVT